MKKINIVLIVFIFLSCDIKKPDTSTVNGVYMNNDNHNDLLILNKNKKYYRIIDNDTIINGNKWNLSTDDVFLEKWINTNYFPREFHEQSPILNCRYDKNGICFKIEINSDGDYFIKK